MDIVEFNYFQTPAQTVNNIKILEPEESQQISRSYAGKATIQDKYSGLYTDAITYANASRTYGLDINLLLL